jgi:carboxymethylenebutenolidase
MGTGFAEQRGEDIAMTVIQNEVQDVETPTGPMRTFLFRPAAPGKYPGVLLYSEIFQMTGPVQRMATQLAGNGYLVAVPEIYHELEPAGTVLAYDAAGSERGNAHKTAKPLTAYDSDARAALAMLQDHPHSTGRLGVMGICIGGHLAFRAARNPQVRAAACFYATDLHSHSLGLGKNDDTLDRLSEITGEMLMVWGRQDPHVPREGRRMIYEAMNDAGLQMQWYECNGAHAFLRDEGPRYDPALARLSYALVLELFHRRLGQGDQED